MSTTNYGNNSNVSKLMVTAHEDGQLQQNVG